MSTVSVYGFRNRINGKMNIGVKSADGEDMLTYITSLNDEEFWEDYSKGLMEKSILFIGESKHEDLAKTIEWFALKYGISTKPEKFYLKKNNAHCVDEKLLTKKIKEIVIDYINGGPGIDIPDAYAEDKTSIGGAQFMWHQISENTEPRKQASVYYGPQYDSSTYENDLEGLDVTDTSYDEVAKLIRDGNIVTMFQGRSEGGPRALGNRSILFDPTIKDGKDIVNAVKRREWFRPFACSIKQDQVNDWFDLAGREETPHMMYAVKCLPGVEEKIPSVIHVDGTCRIQTVTPEQNEHYYNLIDAFEKLSEVPILFNTSFNLGGDPLVETIEDAVLTLRKSDIEYMYLPEIQKLVYVPN